MIERGLPMLDSGYLFIHIPKTAGRSIIACLGLRLNNHHYPIYDYCKTFGVSVIRNCFKFTTVRNPWDRAVSCWSFFGNMGPHRNGFEDWLRMMAKAGIPRRHRGRFRLDQMSYCKTDGGEVLIDAFLRFEHIQQDWPCVAKKIGASEKIPWIGGKHKLFLSRMREAMLRSNRPSLAPLVPTDDFRDMYTTQESIDIVAQLDAETISRFGYTFR